MTKKINYVSIDNKRGKKTKQNKTVVVKFIGPMWLKPVIKKTVIIFKTQISLRKMENKRY